MRRTFSEHEVRICEFRWSLQFAREQTANEPPSVGAYHSCPILLGADTWPRELPWGCLVSARLSSLTKMDMHDLCFGRRSPRDGIC